MLWYDDRNQTHLTLCLPVFSWGTLFFSGTESDSFPVSAVSLVSVVSDIAVYSVRSISSWYCYGESVFWATKLGPGRRLWGKSGGTRRKLSERNVPFFAGNGACISFKIYPHNNIYHFNFEKNKGETMKRGTFNYWKNVPGTNDSSSL